MKGSQIEDGVADQLAGTVVGHVSAAVDLVQRDPATGEQLIRSKHVGSVGVTAQSEHGRMLQQQEHVVETAFGHQRSHLGLEAKAFGVVDTA